MDLKRGLQGVGTTAGVNTYTTTLSVGVTALVDEATYIIKFTSTNTGAATLNINSIGVTPLKRVDGSALQAGDIEAGKFYRLIFDGTNLQLPNSSVPVGKSLYVDTTNGSDTNGSSGHLAKPFLTIGAAKTAAVSGDLVIVRPGTYDENDLAKDGVALHFESGAAISYSGGGTVGKAIIDASGFVSDIAISGDGFFTNSRVGGGIESRVFNIIGGTASLKFKKALAINDDAFFGQATVNIEGYIESNGGDAIGGSSSNQVRFSGKAKSTAGRAVNIAGSGSVFNGSGKLISTTDIGLYDAGQIAGGGVNGGTTFSGYVEGLRFALQRDGRQDMAVEGVLFGGLINSGDSQGGHRQSLTFTGNMHKAGARVEIQHTEDARTVLNGYINNPHITSTNATGIIVINSTMTDVRNSGAIATPFNITAGICIFNGRYQNFFADKILVSGGELQINGEIIYDALAAKIIATLSGTGKLVVNGRLKQLWDNVAGNAIEITGTSATLVLNGSEIIITNASAEDIVPDTVNTPVNVQGSAVTNVVTGNVNIDEEVNTITRDANVI